MLPLRLRVTILTDSVVVALGARRAGEFNA
jgi:hypothetical protein